MSIERLTLSVVEAAKLLGLSRSSMYQAIATGQIAHLKIGRRILIPRITISKMLAEAGNGAKTPSSNG